MERNEAIQNACELWSVDGRADGVNAFLTSLRSAGFVVVPVEATDAMLAAAVPDPVHLYAGRDADYAMQMNAAVTADRIVAALTYRAMIAEFTPPAAQAEDGE